MIDWLSVAVMGALAAVVVMMRMAELFMDYCERWVERRTDAIFLQAKGTALEAARSYGTEKGKTKEERPCPSCAGELTVNELATGVPGALPVLEVRCKCGLCDTCLCLPPQGDDDLK